MTGPARIWRSSLRLRLAVTGTLLAAVIFAIAGPIAISLYHGSLTDSVWGSVTGAASQVAAKLESSQQVPDPIPMPVSAGVPRIQVLDARNHVVTGDPASAARPAIYQLPTGRSSQRAVLSHPAFLAARRGGVRGPGGDAPRTRDRGGRDVPGLGRGAGR